MIHRIVGGPGGTNTYLYIDGEYGIIVDAVKDCVPELERVAAQHKIKILFLINTHGHYDHISENKAISDKFKIPIYIHKLDAERIIDPLKIPPEGPYHVEPSKPSKLVEEGEEFEIGNSIFSIFHTPGHTEGSVCIYSERKKILFSGDTIFLEAPGKTSLPGGNQKKLEASIARLSALDGDVIVYPGHGESGLLKEFTWMVADDIDYDAFYPNERTSQREKSRYTPYKAGGASRTK